MIGFLATCSVATAFLGVALVITYVLDTKKKTQPTRKELQADLKSLREAMQKLSSDAESLARHSMSITVK